MKDIEKYIPFAKKACDFLTNSPDPYHCVKNNIAKLEAAGYTQLSKREPFSGKVQPGGKYYYTYNRTTLVAFAVGCQYQPGNGFKIVGGHTDSPNLKVKPHSKSSGSGCVMLGVECYGGGLWHTWLDRDLGLSGRVLVREKDSLGREKIVQKFVKISRPIARVSSLCIHLKTVEERKSLTVNKETHLTPILGTAGVLLDGVKRQLTGNESSAADRDDEGKEQDFWKRQQDPLLLDLLATELGVAVRDIADFELNLFDTQPACLGGIKNEFLYSARLDNQATCFVAIESLIAHTNTLSSGFEQDCDISMVCLFDHEEVGSSSAHGAGSPIVSEAVRRISTALSENPGTLNPDLYSASIRKSFLFSVDQAHAIHPSFPSKHEKNHSPFMNAGVVIKTNQNQRYTTNGVTGFIVREIVRKAKLVPVQEFVVRNDCPCGSTIGPILSATTGIRTVDAGMPQLSMHSCREVMGVVDLTNGMELIQAFFQHFREIDDNLEG